MYGMDGSGMMGGPWMMMGMGLICALALVALILVILASIKYLRS